MNFSELVILSGTKTSRSEVFVESKDPYYLLGTRRDFISEEARP
jgi:hypothetical protein